MSKYLKEISRTFNEFLLIPNLTKKNCVPQKVDVSTAMAKYKKGQKSRINIHVPMVSAIMQSVSDANMAIALAKLGGVSFIFSSQPIDSQVEMIAKVKKHKAGFVISDSNLKKDSSLKDVIKITKKTGHSTIAITEDGSLFSKFLGVITSRDYGQNIAVRNTKAAGIMTPLSNLVVGDESTTLEKAGKIIWKNKLDCLPILDKNQCLKYFVFRKDIEEHHSNPYESVDKDMRLLVGAGINTHDYEDRVPELVKAGADILCVDSSDGYSEWQRDAIKFVKSKFGKSTLIGGGNVVHEDGFKYLVDAGADFVKVGIGGGSICITREQKGIGRGQASALISVVKARNDYYKKTGIYVPICSDGGIAFDYHITLALAMGADFVMMGRYFARADEAPGKKVRIGGSYFKEYWAEGSNRAKNWQRYDLGGDNTLSFEEGVDGHVSYAGPLQDNLLLTINKIKSTMCNCGALTLPEFQKKARMTVVSSTSLVEGKVHDIVMKNEEKFQ